MKTTKTIGGALVFATAAAGCALRWVMNRTHSLQLVEQEHFDDCALCTLEGEGGIVRG